MPGGTDPHATRLWSAWQSDGTAWLAARPGDGPPDGSVVGWRFAVSPDGAASEPPAGEMPVFETVCGKDAAASGHKRVAVVVDFGDADADAFPGEQPPRQDVVKCVAGAEGATAVQLLASAARVRVNDQGGVVAVDDYPAREKGGAEPAAPAAAESAGESGGSPVVWIAGGAGVLLLLGGGAVVATRRRAKSPAAG
ncbi:hypothetical protein HII36_44760 [Nonomuraea sp. NN258]|uniref:SCO2322 family protein n=1 Tax=Nonomuraea antri TaxID=2730852 RepID=UPI001567F7E8|nr:SCO2322 family protein [Nonomuraea antri]NRQ38887.1 hypothetical protein [Nonomuraea antri]